MCTKKRETILFIIAAFLFVMAGSLFMVLHLGKKKQQIPQADYTKLILERVIYLEQKTERQIIDNQWAYWGNDSFNGLELQQLAAKDHLFFYFSEKVCPPCMIAAIDLIKRYIPEYEHHDTVIFISPDWPYRLRNDCYGKKLLTLQNGTLGIALEAEDAPFFFKLSPEMALTSVHVVAKVDFKRTEDFIKYFIMNHKLLK